MSPPKVLAEAHILDAIRQLRRAMLDYGLDSPAGQQVHSLILQLEEVRGGMKQLPIEKIIHSGYVVEQETKTFYYVDDRDALPPDIREYEEKEFEDFSYMTLMSVVREGELQGNEYVVQIGDMYYETVDEPEPHSRDGQWHNYEGIDG
jgi:hypothetical protein